MSNKVNKAIASSAGASASPENKSLSTVTKGMLTKSLTPKEAFTSSIHVRKAIGGIADQISKMKLRIFSRRSNQEIVSGPLYDLFRSPSKNNNTANYINGTVSNYLIHGEVAVWMMKGTGTKPTKLFNLSPDRLSANPSYCRSYEMLDGWYYNDPLSVGQTTGMLQLPADQVIHCKNFNPQDNLRGLSLLVSGSSEISTNYFVSRHNSSFFQNGAHTDLIVRFPKGTDKKIAEEWVERWQLQHSVMQGNGFKISAIIGDDMQIENPATTARDGQFLQLSELTQENIGGLLGCPPSVMGFLSKTRFDTIDVELESFAENTLLPIAEMWSAGHQSQLVDRYFSSSGMTKKIDGKMSKRTKALYTKIADENTESDLVILLDPDSLPIMGRINIHKFNNIAALAESAQISRFEAAEYLGLEVSENEVNTKVWIPANLVNPTAASENAAIVDEVKALKKQIDSLSNEAKVVGKSDVEKDLLYSLRRFYQEYRGMVLDCVDSEGSYDKRHVSALAVKHNIPNDVVNIQIHKDFLHISSLSKTVTNKEELLRKVKDHFNLCMKNSAFYGLIKGK